MRTINHVLRNVKHSTSIYKVRVEPEMERSLASIIKLNAHIIIYQQVQITAYAKVLIALIPDVLREPLSFVSLIDFPLIEDVPFANNLKVGEHATLLETRYRDHPDLVNLLHHCLVMTDCLLDLSGHRLEKVLEVVHIADLTRDGDTFTVRGPDLTIVHQGFVSALA